MARLATRKACLNCRQRHLKCDYELPSCQRCRLSKLACRHPIAHKFRSVRFDGLNESQNRDGSLRPSSSLQFEQHGSDTPDRFVDETDSVIQSQDWRTAPERSAGEAKTAAETPTNLNPLPSSLSPSASYYFNHPPSIIGLPLAANVHQLSNGGPSNHYDQDAHETATSVDLQGFSSSEVPAQTGPSITHPREAYLVKVFTQTWGPIFDCLDADLTFTTSVLHIGLTSCQPLFWAILATSALQLSRVSNYPFSAAQHYRQMCSKSIMPLLLQSASSEANEETLFATYVMLRNYDHLTENMMEKNVETLFTAALAISVNPSHTVSDEMDLGRAAFWVHLRQDIHVALLRRVPINTDYPPCLRRENILENLNSIIRGKTTVRQESLDCAWANSMAILLVDIINYCFQPESRVIGEWIELRGRLDHWNLAKPKKFQPYYERPPSPSEGRSFPDIWIASDCCVLAWLYYHTATILLKTYPPSEEGNGTMGCSTPILQGLEATEEVLIHTRAVCGIALTNPNAQALIVFCHMVTISAIFFTNEAEQNATISLLGTAHTVTGHPLHDVKQKLYSCWDRPAPS